ncbi:MAG TPA: glycosyltransferase family 1 protein [Candidatus Magasanikbacteria bacterium]|nr:glycosyltransferase family 1 protein [Candidatus Magasanikbacteria bacterium]
MKIGIDARMYGTRSGGLGRYVQKLIENLEKIDSQNEYVIFLRQENWEEYTPSVKNFRKVLADVYWYGWREQIILPGILRREKLDLMHFPHWNIPILYRGGFVVTIHDLILRRHPTRRASTLGFFMYVFKNILYRIITAWAAHRAKKIFTVSQNAAADIVELLHVPREKIVVTYLAPSFEQGIDREMARDYVRQKFGLQGDYALYVGVAFPHKNLERLVRVWQKVRLKLPEATLVLAGKENYFYKNLQEILENEGLMGVRRIDFPNDEDVHHLMSAARLYVMPSMFEGFGVPPLDALVCNTPVVSSNVTSLPEVLGEAALYFDPTNETEMVDAIWRGWTDENLRFEILRNAPAELEKFSYVRMADSTLSVYRQVKK